jgi:hypothetical protein
MSVTILTVVHHDSGLIKYMIDSVHKFSKDVPKIIICDNGGNKKFLEEYRQYKNITIVKNKPKSKDAANIHGESLDKIFGMVKTKYTVIMDSDCVVLSDKWNQFDDKYKAITAKKGSKGGVNKHHFCFVMFKTEDFKGISFRPIHSRKYKKLPWDTGCVMSQKIHDEKLIVENLKVVGCTSGDCKVFDDRFPKSFELWRDEKPIVAHFVAGSNLSRRRVNKYGHGGTKQFNDWKKIIVDYIK